MVKELKLYKHNKEEDVYLLGYENENYITGILLKDSRYSRKGEYSREWFKSVFKECIDISSGNISITSNVSDTYLDKDNNPVMKCSSVNGTRYILINSMEEYEGSLKDLTIVDKVIIKVH